DTDVHSGAAAAVPSAPWRLVNALASLRDGDGTIRIRGFFDDVRGPTESEQRALADGSDSEDADLLTLLGISEFQDGVSGAALRERLSLAPTANLAGFHSGYGGPGVKTVLPA